MAAALSVPKESYNGDPSHFQSGLLQTTPGETQLLLSETVPDNIERDLYSAIVVCSFTGMVQVLLYDPLSEETTVIASDRTGPANPKAKFDWFPPFPVQPNQTISITFQLRDNGPVAPIEAYFMCADNLI